MSELCKAFKGEEIRRPFTLCWGTTISGRLRVLDLDLKIEGYNSWWDFVSFIVFFYSMSILSGVQVNIIKDQIDIIGDQVNIIKGQVNIIKGQVNIKGRVNIIGGLVSRMRIAYCLFCGICSR